MMTDPSLNLNLTPAKRAECEVITHPDEPPNRLHQSLPKDHGPDSDSDSPFDPDIYDLFTDQEIPGEEGVEESDEEVGVTDEVRNSEEYKEYRRLVDQTEGYDCGNFNFPYFDYAIVQLSEEERHEELRVKYLLPFIDKYNKEQNRKLVLDSIEKVNVQCAIIYFEKYYITFKVKDMDDGAALKTFQCSFIVCMTGPAFGQFREKPSTI